MPKKISIEKREKIKELYDEGYTQCEIATELGICQSTVHYYTSRQSRIKARLKRIARYRILITGGFNMKHVIYRRNGYLYMTNEENYNSIIEDATKITKLRDFNSFDEVVDYMCKYTKASKDDFIDRTGDSI